MSFNNNENQQTLRETTSLNPFLREPRAQLSFVRRSWLLKTTDYLSGTRFLTNRKVEHEREKATTELVTQCKFCSLQKKSFLYCPPPHSRTAIYLWTYNARN
ncbi:uncharacterized protein LOC143239085 [Tachypleus tridentatus]|uniref:uncharacterized protein LOC143239085 n=1 Tax=Tachypleus tridentatus TaxID=6853 RepID=UPI003FD10111